MVHQGYAADLYKRPEIILYSGHIKDHCIKFQQVQLPSGMIAIMDGPYPGSRHDAGILKDRGMGDLLEEVLGTSDCCV